MAERYFPYGEKEIAYLKSRDRRLGEIIDILGHPERPLDDDLFSAVIHHIVAQKISAKAGQTIWNRMNELLGEITPARVSDAGTDTLQSVGMTYKKAESIHAFAEKVISCQFDLNALNGMRDEEAIKALSSLDGIGTWTAEMLLLHCLQRPDILSFGDLAIQRGMRMVYRHRKIDKKLFETYKRRYSPYGSVAAIYLWKVSAGAIDGLTDPAQTKKGKK